MKVSMSVVVILILKITAGVQLHIVQANFEFIQ